MYMYIKCTRSTVCSRFASPTQRGNTALHLACKRGQVGIALLLLHGQCHSDVIDVCGETPLHTCCRDGLLPVVQTMCAFGCKVDIANKVCARLS